MTDLSSDRLISKTTIFLNCRIRGVWRKDVDVYMYGGSTGLSALMSEKSVVQLSDFYTSNYEAKHLLSKI